MDHTEFMALGVLQINTQISSERFIPLITKFWPLGEAKEKMIKFIGCPLATK